MSDLRPRLILSALLLISIGRGLALSEVRAMERVKVSPDGRGFVLAESGRPFIPWGLNYGNSGRLIEDFWETEWQTVSDDFAEMRDLGANVVRVHLQLGRFMEAADKTNPRSIERLAKLLELAERVGLYLDITGLGCYRTKDIPAWYDPLDEDERWAVQARFWEAVAEKCAASPAVFCLDLMNEPLSPAGRREPGAWYSGKLFGGYDFLQWIALDQRDRPRDQIACEWIKTLSAAIRRRNPHHLITVGLLPSTPQWGHFSGFLPETVAAELDFVSVHIYPETGKSAEAMATLRGFAVKGKPTVVEETFPLTCPSADLRKFLVESKEVACGWMGHYDGMPIAELEGLRSLKKISLAQQAWLDWLNLFRDARAEMLSEPADLPRTPLPLGEDG